MNDDGNDGFVDVGVGLDEVGAYYGCEEFGWRDGVLLSENVDRIFDGISGDDGVVVAFGITIGINVRLYGSGRPLVYLRGVNFAL